MNKKILHLHLKDGNNNLSTLICRLKEGSIKYIFYGGTGSSGTPYSLRNIQFYDLVNGNISWDRNKSLPVDTRLGETEEEFKQRVIDMLNHSTRRVVNVVSNEVTFA
jgi:hypothetical protein